jgi:predicted alpha/beta superfamily hydrolase
MFGLSRKLWVSLISVTCAASALAANWSNPAAPLTIGETFLLKSSRLHETRRINVYFPPEFSAASSRALPVLYMPDGGIGEDFLHIAGLIQVSVGNQTMRPWLLVGIENTERRRDLTGPTESDKDRRIATRAGGSQLFRDFLRAELMPEIQRRYKTTNESAIVGESLAGLFVMDTLRREPDLFGTYIAIDPSLWWNNSELLNDPAALFGGTARSGKRLFLAWSSDAEPDIKRWACRLDATLQAARPSALEFRFRAFPDESHATIYQPAALVAFRSVLSTYASAENTVAIAANYTADCKDLSLLPSTQPR